MTDFGDSPLDSIGNVELNSILNDVSAFIKRFCVFPNKHCLATVTLWAAHTHIIESLWTTPRLAILSPEVESGKSRVLDVLELLVQESFYSITPTPATIFRMLKTKKITLLFDECDAIFKRHGKDDSHEDLRALLNAGYRRGATIPRCVPPKWEVEVFEVFCAVAMAGLNTLPPTILSRSVVIGMKRRTKDEKVEQYRYRHDHENGHELRDRLAGWAEGAGNDANDKIPEMPDGIVDRQSEVWEPLLIVADMAGGNWPKVAREACLVLCERADDGRDTLGVKLLSDLKKVFGSEDRLRTAEIVKRLTKDAERVGESGQLEPLLDDDAPWPVINHGQPLTSLTLARLLKPYGVKSTKIRIGEKPFQGYYADKLMDAQTRYPLIPENSEQTEQTEQQDNAQANIRSIVPGVPGIPASQGMGIGSETKSDGEVKV